MRRRSARALSSSMSALWFANDPPAALDLRPGERCRVHAVPERAALEELLLFQSDRQYKAFLFTGISEALASAQGSCRSESG